MAGSRLVVSVARAFLEAAELDELVAHHVGVRRESASDLVDGIGHHAVPVFLLQVDDVEVEAILACSGLAKLDVLLGSAGEVGVAIHTDLDVEKIRFKSLFTKEVYDNSAVDTS
jgi:hypothetical protein